MAAAKKMAAAKEMAAAKKIAAANAVLQSNLMSLCLFFTKIAALGRTAMKSRQKNLQMRYLKWRSILQRLRRCTVKVKGQQLSLQYLQMELRCRALVVQYEHQNISRVRPTQTAHYANKIITITITASYNSTACVASTLNSLRSPLLIILSSPNSQCEFPLVPFTHASVTSAPSYCKPSSSPSQVPCCIL